MKGEYILIAYTRPVAPIQEDNHALNNSYI